MGEKDLKTRGVGKWRNFSSYLKGCLTQQFSKPYLRLKVRSQENGTSHLPFKTIQRSHHPNLHHAPSPLSYPYTTLPPHPSTFTTTSIPSPLPPHPCALTTSTTSTPFKLSNSRARFNFGIRSEAFTVFSMRDWILWWEGGGVSGIRGGRGKD